MKKRNCRMSDTERDRHDRAIRIRKMTDAKLCAFMDELGNGGTLAENRATTVEAFLTALGQRTATGLRTSDATIRKLRSIAEAEGFLPREEE
ncbi:MAG: hypothetical protein RR365_15420 [Bacteroides sp.]